MTEIPEHLLRRSKSAKSSKTGEPVPAETAGTAAVPAASGSAGVAATAGVPPALAQAAAAIGSDPTPPPAKPVPPYIAAAHARKKMPIWALGLVAALPLWAWIYAGTMQLQETEDALLGDAAEVYAVIGGCAGCHGAEGGGASGYQLSGGEVTSVFPHAIDQMVHVARGSGPIQGQPYGDPDRAGGGRVAGARGAMPGFADSLSLQQLELVVYHERITLSGESADSAANLAWEEALRARLEEAPIPIDLDLLLSCANPEFTPGATGAPDDPSACPGPAPE